VWSSRIDNIYWNNRNVWERTHSRGLTGQPSTWRVKFDSGTHTEYAIAKVSYLCVIDVFILSSKDHLQMLRIYFPDAEKV
jgi:hypothetical protein